MQMASAGIVSPCQHMIMVSFALQFVIRIMFQGYFNITVIEEWVTFLAAIFLLNSKTGIWQLFKLLMALILITESLGWYLRTHGHQHENAIPFNVLMLFTDLFLIWFFAVSEWFRKERKFLFISMVIFIVLFTI